METKLLFQAAMTNAKCSCGCFSFLSIGFQVLSPNAKRETLVKRRLYLMVGILVLVLTMTTIMVQALILRPNNHHQYSSSYSTIMWTTTMPTGTVSRRLQTSLSSSSSSSFLEDDQQLDAAVLVPGFLTGAAEFQSLADDLTHKCGIPTLVVPFPNWHWIPCLGGRSIRPMLERLDYAVQHFCAAHGNLTRVQEQLLQTPIQYTGRDLWRDFQTNPGGIYQVGGSARVDDYPTNVHPQGQFPLPSSLSSSLSSNSTATGKKKIALIGHSAGGWIARIYLSNVTYGGKVYRGQEHVHSLVTLGTPHGPAPGFAFEGIQWIDRIEKQQQEQREQQVSRRVRQLAVGGTGFMGGEWGGLTKGAYAFCCLNGTDGTHYDGDGVTPIQSALAWKGAEQMVIENVTHFCWSDVFGSSFVAPELTRDHKEGRPWYGSPGVLEQWAGWITKKES